MEAVALDAVEPVDVVVSSRILLLVSTKVGAVTGLWSRMPLLLSKYGCLQ